MERHGTDYLVCNLAGIGQDELAQVVAAHDCDLYDSISVNADVPGSEGDSIAARPVSTK